MTLLTVRKEIEALGNSESPPDWRVHKAVRGWQETPTQFRFAMDSALRWINDIVILRPHSMA
jgi:hypothetical protein